MKKRAGIIILVIIMLIPTVIAIVDYNIVKNSSVSQKSISAMKLTDLAGKEFDFEKSSNELDVSDLSTNPIRFFMQLNSAAAQETALPEPLKGTEYYKAVYTSYGRDVEYKYYFTSSAEYCYFIDDESRCFKITEEYATLFLNSQYGMSLFENAALPVMTLSNGDVIEPAAIQWKYSTAEGVYSTYKHEETKSDTTSHTISGAVELVFDNQPDSILVVIKKGDEEIFNGTYDDVGRVDIAVNTEISVTATATWAESQMRGYSGDATYSFNAVYLDKPIFYLGETNVDAGDFVVLTAKNVSDSSSFTFASQPELNYTPIFFQDGVYYRALIPLPIDVQGATSYKLTCTADGVSQDILLNVTPRKTSPTNTPEVIGDFKTQLASVFATQTTKKYFDGIFTDPVADKMAKIGFGRVRPNANGDTFTHQGYDYTARDGGTVSAVNNGIVLYAGEIEGCGKIVVIDHGFGLMTSYVYMSTITVQVGDEVRTDQQIGTCGYSDYLHLELTVFGHPCDIDTLWRNGVVTND